MFSVLGCVQFMPKFGGLGITVVGSPIIGEHVGVTGQGVQVFIIVIVEDVEQLHIDKIMSMRLTMVV